MSDDLRALRKRLEEQEKREKRRETQERIEKAFTETMKRINPDWKKRWT